MKFKVTKAVSWRLACECGTWQGLRFSIIFCSAMLYSLEPTASIFRIFLILWGFGGGQYFLLWHRYLSTRLNGVTSQNVVILMEDYVLYAKLLPYEIWNTLSNHHHLYDCRCVNKRWQCSECCWPGCAMLWRPVQCITHLWPELHVQVNVHLHTLVTLLNIVTIYVCAYKRGMDWILDLVTTRTHHSELQVIAAPLLISTVHRSPQHPLSLFPACCVFKSHSLAMASNSGNSSASCAHVITVQQISRNWTLVNCQLNYSAISSQPPLQSSTQLPTLN
jgi:hypothetical protein